MSHKPPERKRALIIGAGPTGMSVAFHLGEHSLLLERRDETEHYHDYSHDLAMGAAHGGTVGDEDAGADGHGFPTPAERKAVYISCSASTQSDTGEHTLIHVERWRPPDLAPPRERVELITPAVRTLRPLLRGELRMGSHVVRVSPEAHLLELADGHRFIYDKLVSTLSLTAIEMLVAQDLPRHVRRDESLRYWLSELDIEVVDRDIQQRYGDIDEFAAGRRVADLVTHALAEKFGGTGRSRIHSAKLFRPRLVSAVMP